MLKKVQVKVKGSLLFVNLQYEKSVAKEETLRNGRTVPLAGLPSFIISLRCITNKVVFMNT